MNFSKTKLHDSIYIIALAVAVVALPFSVSICHAGLLLLVANWILEGQWKNKWNSIKQKPHLLPFILYFFLSIVGLSYSKDITNGLFNIEKKIFFFLLPFIFASIIITKKRFHLLLKSFIATCTIACVICLSIAIYHIVIPPDYLPANFDFANTEEFKLMNPDISPAWAFLSYYELSSGIHIHPSYLGLYILFSILLLAYFYKDEKNTLPLWKTLCALFLFLFFSIFILMLSARIITITYMLLCVAIAWWVFSDSGKYLVAISGVLAVLFFSIASILINPIARYRSIQEFTHVPLSIENNKLYTTSSSIRLSLWWIGIQAIKESNWLIGNGIGDVIKKMTITGKKYGITNTINSFDPHNQFIYSFLSLGAAGLIALLGCLLMPLIHQGMSVHFIYACFIAIVLIISLTESFLQLQKGIVFFSIFNSLFVFQFQPVSAPSLKISHV